MTSDEGVSLDTPGATKDFNEYSSVSYVPENQYSLGNFLSFDIGSATDSTGSPRYAPEVCCDADLVAISAANSPEQAESPSYRTWTPSPHGVLYKNLHHKFGSVLAMCELDIRLKPNLLRISS